MKSCLSLTACFMLCCAAAYLFPKIYEWRMTPEERAAAVQRAQVAAEQEQARATVQAENERRKSAEIAALQEPFLQELVAMPTLNQAVFMDHEVLRVRFAPLVHQGEDHVRVMCEGIARLWAGRAGLEYVRCESWYGNKRYASGTYQGSVPPEYLARVIEKTMHEQQAKDAAALVALEGKTLLEVEGTHGPALSKNKDTGWAEFRTFRARFESGKVAEVSVK